MREATTVNRLLGAQRADTGDLLKLLTQFAAAMPSLDLRFEFAYLAIQFLEMRQPDRRESLRSKSGFFV
jgi:hypothetical protein